MKLFTTPETDNAGISGELRPLDRVRGDLGGSSFDVARVDGEGLFFVGK